jgi:hypothetical protein
MSQQSVGEHEPDRRAREDAVLNSPASDDVVEVEDPGRHTGQVLGQSVPLRRDVTQADPGSPETGAVRDEEGRPSAEKPLT